MCDQCNYLYINGIGCHETGCPNQGSIHCESCQQVVQKHNVHYANNWDGLQYCRECAQIQVAHELNNDDSDAY